ncbi:MAG: 4Fe-4S dicluster domain-containing protein [bacterium]|nr:4Fe-4S dicluster domain-containing protein [bacterium]
MSFTRRDLFKMAAVGAATSVGGSLQASDDAYPIDCSQTYGVLVDTVVCIGCRKCEWACNNEHKLSTTDIQTFEDKSVYKTHRRPVDNAYTVVNEFKDPKNAKPYTMKVQCMHCNHPACVSACIVGALKKNKLGSVDYDAWKCIGCRYCMVACPFQIPAYEYQEALKPRVMKCTFCLGRLEEGRKPACVGICPNEALTFGTREQLINLANERIKAKPELYHNHVYGENEIGGTSWMYLASTDFINTELPKLTNDPIPHTTETIQHGVFKSFVPPLALYGLLGLIMHSLRENKEDKESDDDRS